MPRFLLIQRKLAFSIGSLLGVADSLWLNLKSPSNAISAPAPPALSPAVPHVPECNFDHIRGIRGWVMDLSGVFHNWAGLLPGAHGAIRWLEEFNVPHVFLTNAFQSRETIIAKFNKPKYASPHPFRSHQIYTVADAFYKYMTQEASPGSYVFLSGPSEAEFHELFWPHDVAKTWRVRSNLPADEAENWANDMTQNNRKVFIVLAMSDTTFDLNFGVIATVGILMRNGAALVGCGGNLFDNRARSLKYPSLDVRWPNVGVIEQTYLAVGTCPTCPNKSVNVGKGGTDAKKWMFDPAVELLKQTSGPLANQEIALVGDSLPADISVAVAANVKSILVLSGVSSLDDMKRSPVLPTCYVNSIGDLAAIAKQETQPESDGQRPAAQVEGPADGEASHSAP